MAGRGESAVVVSCGFESAGDTWSFTPIDPDYSSTDLGADDVPTGQRVLSGFESWQVPGGATSTLKFADVLLSGWTGVSITYRVSSTAATGGHSGFDMVRAYVAETRAGLDSASPLITLKGNGNAVWGYQSGAPQQVATAGSEGIICQPGVGAPRPRTADGYSNFKIEVPYGQSSVALKISLKNTSASTHWNLDDVVLEGQPTSSHDCLWAGGASGTWNNSTTPKCWIDQSKGSVLSAWNGANGDNAFFAQADSIVTIADATTVVARSLTFDADGCVIEAGDSSSCLALTNGGSGGAGANTIKVANAGQTATINAKIVGNLGVGVVKTGAGTLVLGGEAAFSGAVDVRQGTLRLGAGDVLGGCSTIAVGAGATLDVAAVADYRLGDACQQRLEGAGTVVGNLRIDQFGTHDVGSSPGVQCVRGNYTMNGILLVEVDEDSSGDGAIAYDQVMIADGDKYNVSLSGTLLLAWSGTGGSSANEKLWIIRNDTSGELEGMFSNYNTNGASVGSYGGRLWNIYYDADAEHEWLSGGNDVLLMATTPIPEPGSPALLLSLGAAMWLARRWGAAPAWFNNL